MRPPRLNQLEPPRVRGVATRFGRAIRAPLRPLVRDRRALPRHRDHRRSPHHRTAPALMAMVDRPARACGVAMVMADRYDSAFSAVTEMMIDAAIAAIAASVSSGVAASRSTSMTDIIMAIAIGCSAAIARRESAIGSTGSVAAAKMTD